MKFATHPVSHTWVIFRCQLPLALRAAYALAEGSFHRTAIIDDTLGVK